MRKITLNSILILLTLLFVLLFTSCKTTTQNSAVKAQRGNVRLMFYNVENLFDTFDDPLTNDQEFLPNGSKRWTFTRYKKKINNIAKVITAIGQWEAPEMIGLCEIENQKVLEDITKSTALSKINYGIVHKESPDKRGIDVAILYRKDRVTPLKYRAIGVNLGGDSDRPTRDILYFKCLLESNDTLHFFVNHWPSRWGGAQKSQPKRVDAATTLRHVVDSVLAANPMAKVVITGDFNDDPIDKSISEVLDAKEVSVNTSSHLHNLSLQYLKPGVRGSLKYKGNWNVFDQFIVSDGLLSSKSGLHTSVANCHIFYGTADNEFLLEKDDRYVGMQPFRTYHGLKFHDGYSDHLPVYLDLVK